MAVSPLDLWNRWGIQILLLLSLCLQVLLHPLAGVRRRSGSGLQRGVLWLVYQLASSTAIVAMGHLTLINDDNSSRDRRRLTALWAPFLLLHQGGPDSIGAYALQDNQLWLRHLKLLVMQALAAAYVLYKRLPIRGSFMLQLAAFLMWALGVVRYTEKVVALKRGNWDSIRSSLKKQPVVVAKHHHHLNNHTDDEEVHLRHAHHLFHISRRATVDSWLDKDPEHNTFEMLKALRKKDYRGMWAFAEMVTSLMYDIPYTKAGVVHTWPGYITRLMSSLAIIPSSSLLFHFSGKAGHSKTDVAVTYTLLAGAFLVEVASLLGALGSTWAYAFLSTTRWSWLRYATLCTGRWDQLRRLVKLGVVGTDVVSDRRWSGRMGQYNMLHFSGRRKVAHTPMLGRVVSVFGFEEFWNRKHFATTVDISDDLKQQLFEYIQRTTKAGLKTQHGMARESCCWGQEALEEEDKDLYERIKEKKNLGVEFQDGIMIWHIGTDIFLARRKSYSRDVAGLVKSIRVLSNYMVFLVVEHPNMLPGLAQTTVYHRTCQNLSDRCSRTLVHPTSNVSSALKQIFSVRDGPDFGEQRQADELANIVYKERPQYSPDVPRLSHANGVAEELVNRQKQKGSNSVLKLLLSVWMDFLVYAANRCSRESHCKKLGRGGELTTVMWIMGHYLNQEAYLGQRD